MSVSFTHGGGVARTLVTGGAWLVIAASTALGADCWASRSFMCCRSFGILCKFGQSSQTIIWGCPQTSDKPDGFTVTVLVPAGKKVKGKTGVAPPVLEGMCKVTRTKCGEFPGECIPDGQVEKKCYSTKPEGDDCQGV